MTALSLGEIVEITLLTLRVTAGATLLGTLVGVPVGVAFGLRARPTLHHFRVLLYTFYSFPPVVAGLLGYLLFTRSGPLGALGLLFTPTAIVLVESALAGPLIAGLTVAAIAEVPPNVREAILASGASPLRAAWTVVEEARYGVVAGVMVGFGRSLAEVAGAMLVGGNVRHETRTLGTAILQSTAQGDFGLALALAGILLAVALATVLVLVRVQTRHRERSPW